MLAVAGSGKTYRIANEVEEEKKNILISFTRQNVANIRREIIKRLDYVPKSTHILTFSSFVYRWLLKPMEPIIKVGKKEGLLTKGVDLREPQPQSINGKANYLYVKDSEVEHYISPLGKYYSSRMSKLFIKQGKRVKKSILKRLAQFCDAIYIDEAQDFLDNDFKLLRELMEYPTIWTEAVGDFYQHSVSKSDYLAKKPFRDGNRSITKAEYKELFGENVHIDEETLKNSRRSPKLICDFIRKKLEIDIRPNDDKIGEIKRLTNQKESRNILKDEEIKKLIYSRNVKRSFDNYNTWSYCKGDTYDEACVILTQPFDNIFEDDFSIMGFSATQRNKLYVALTRATEKVYLITHADYRSLLKDDES